MKKQFIHAFIAACIMLAITGCKRSSKKTNGVFTVTQENGSVDKKGPEVTGSVNLKVDIGSMSDDKSDTFSLPLPDGKTITLERKRLDRFEKGRFAWYGVIRNDPGSFALISITAKAIAGKITTSKGEIYMLNYTGKNIHRLDKINAGALPERNDDDIEVPASNIATDHDCPDPATQVDIMVLYTADAETGAGGAEGIEAFIYECIYFTNLAYQNSNVNLSMHLVHFERVTYAETGNDNTDLTALQTTADGQMDNIHALRDSHGADLVSLITETLNSCGLAYRLYPVTAGFASSAFSVVKRSCAAAGLSFAHETAHNMGARHDCANASNLPDPNHGHLVSAPADGSGSSWRTVLAYNACTAGPCTRVPYYSNPAISYSPTASASTDPTGTVTAAGVCTDDNASVMNAAAAIVANFRCSSPTVANVWMRDTWNDTGLEPDPATAAESMWRSPYIWIRNTAQDPTFLHQHEHENPRMGVPNWIYVKMHNGGAEDMGNLEIWYADASVSLTWPGAWTQLTTVPVTIAAASTKIMEIPWNSLPGEGHYCMVARWSSTADPVGAETANIGDNTRNNNNIIWRNLNIVAMDGDEDEKTQAFFMQGKPREPLSLHFTDDALFPKRKFVETGRIFIKLDEKVFAAWRKAGSKGTGIKASDTEIEITGANASIDNIIPASGEKIKATIRFVKTKQTVSDRYHFTVQQTDANGKTTAGGVSYEIYTYKR